MKGKRASGGRRGRRPDRQRRLEGDSFWSDHSAIKACVLFLVVYCAQVTAIFLWGGRFLNRTAAWTATATALILRALGADGHAHGDLVTSTLGPFTIISECTAVFPITILVSGLVAYPSSARKKLAGLLVGVPLLLAINQIRIVSLAYLQQWFPDSIETLHLLVWQSLMIISTAVVLLLWALAGGPRGETKSPA